MFPFAIQAGLPQFSTDIDEQIEELAQRLRPILSGLLSNIVEDALPSGEDVGRYLIRGAREELGDGNQALRNLIRGLGTFAGDEADDFFVGYQRGLERTIRQTIDNVLTRTTGTITASIFIVILGIGAGIVIPMLLYKVLKHYLINSPPKLASKVSSYWHFFFSRLSIDQIMLEIQKKLILNPEELEQIALYLESLRIALIYNTPLPSLMLIGPPGTGKTKVAGIIAKHFARYMFISGSSFAKFKEGQGIAEMDRMFKWGKKRVTNFRTRACLFIDEIEAFLKKRNLQNSEDRKLFTHFLSYTGLPLKDLLIIGASNVPADIDDAAHRRFTQWIAMKAPNQANRAKILSMYLTEIASQRNFEISLDLTEKVLLQLVKKIEGATGADIEAIVREVNTRAIVERKLTVLVIEKAIESYLNKKQNTQKKYVA
ncbi:MAG: ATP-binding protein [Bacteroidota bacterium]